MPIMHRLKSCWGIADFKSTWLKYTLAAISTIFTIFPESVFQWELPFFTSELGTIINRFIVICIMGLSSVVVVAIQAIMRRKVIIKGKNYRISVEYGNLFTMEDCKKVIAFDECFTTTIGNNPEDIYTNSICGQFLKSHPNLDIKKLIEHSGLQSLKEPSKYNNKIRYKSGTLIPYDEFLLLAFVQLDEDGTGKISYDQYIDSLRFLWQEIDKYHAGMDVCIPVLGAGSATHIQDKELNQQELLDVIIMTYKLSSSKLQYPRTLHIVCPRNDEFSLNRIGQFTG